MASNPARYAGAGFMSFYTDTAHLEALLIHLDAAISPVGLVSFLNADAAPWLRLRAEKRFTGEGDDVSGPWAPLKESTQMIRQSKGFPPAHPINVRTHELEDYITGGALPQGKPTGLGANLIYPGIKPPTGELRKKMETAQIGRNSNPRTVPRPVLGLNGTDLAYVLEMLSLHIAKGSP